MSTSESLKGRVTYQKSDNAWEMLVSAWDCIEMSETHVQMRETRELW